MTSQAVQKGANAGGATEQVAQQVLAYLGNDDPDSMVHTLGASGTNANAKTYAFGYDWRHQLTNTTVTQGAYGVAPYATTSGTAFAGTYDYGNAGRLKKASVDTGLGPIAGGEVKPRNVDYCYDPVDKERVVALKTAAATPCTGAAYATYAYDDAGNQTQRAYPAGSAPNSPSGSGSAETFDYVCDGDDRLRRVTKKVAGAVVGSEEYWYDEQGARVGVLTRDSAGTKQELRWFIGDTQAHYDAAGTVTNVYSHLSLGTPIARVERTGNTTTAVEYQFHGLASNTIAAVGADGIVKANFAYAPYGELIEGQQPAGPAAGLAAHPRRMNDKYIDDLSSLAYYGARYYDNVLIGWTQADPKYRFAPDAAWDSPRRGNLFMFTMSNPIRYRDPDGRDIKQPPLCEPTRGKDTKQRIGRTDLTAAKMFAQARAMVNAAINRLGRSSAARVLNAAGITVVVVDNKTDTSGRANTRFLLLDHSDASINAAKALGATEAAVVTAAVNDGGSNGYAILGEPVVVIWLDVLEMEIANQDSEDAQTYVNTVVEHEFIHRNEGDHPNPKKPIVGTDIMREDSGLPIKNSQYRGPRTIEPYTEKAINAFVLKNYFPERLPKKGR